MKEKNYKYIHIMENRPAHYYPGEQICFAVRTRPIPTCDSLDQIKKEQNMSREWRMKNGYGLINLNYGWMKIKV